MDVVNNVIAAMQEDLTPQQLQKLAAVHRISASLYWCIPLIKNALQGYYYSSEWHWN